MAEETFRWILAAETPDNFRKWFLELFQVSAVASFLFHCPLTTFTSMPKRLNLILLNFSRNRKQNL